MLSVLGYKAFVGLLFIGQLNLLVACLAMTLQLCNLQGIHQQKAGPSVLHALSA